MYQTLKSYNSPELSAVSVVNTYTYPFSSTITNAINFHSGSRRMVWRVELLNNDRSPKTPPFNELTPFVTKMVITQEGSRPVGRSLELDMVETLASQVVVNTGTLSSAFINYLSDLVRPVCFIQLATNEWLRCDIMIGRFTRPSVTAPGYAVIRHATLPDLTSIVQENAAVDPLSESQPIPFLLPGDERVIDVIRSLLMNSPIADADPLNPMWAHIPLRKIPGCALGTLLPSNVPAAPAGNTPGDFPSIDAMIPTGGYPVSEGQSYLDLINHLLYTINCYPLQADERGILRIQPLPLNGTPPNVYPDYTIVDPVYAYDTTHDSIVTFGLTEDILIDDIANVVQVKVEDAQRSPFMATAFNNDPDSPYYVLNWAHTGAPKRIVKVVSDGQVPEATSGADYAKLYAAKELLLASWLTDTVSLPIAVNPLHCGYLDHDVITLNIYQQFYADGSPENFPIITGALTAATPDPGLVVTEKFIIDGWVITAVLATPGSGTNLTGNVGLTTVLEPRESKTGHTQTITAHRVTKTLNPANIGYS